MSEPHFEDRRIPVLNIHESVGGQGSDPRTVADRFNLDVAEVYEALAYYDDNPSQMKQVREARERALETAREQAKADRPAGVKPGE
ncbi:MAG: DUF433 domain-containing protein [Haloarculaceae archaeon]